MRKKGKNRKKKQFQCNRRTVIVKQCQKEYERQNRSKKNVLKKICGRKSKLGVKGRTNRQIDTNASIREEKTDTNDVKG